MGKAKKDDEVVYFTPEALAVIRANLYMSPETWAKVIAADPAGWRRMLEE